MRPRCHAGTSHTNSTSVSLAFGCHILLLRSQVADNLSKNFDTYEYKLSPDDFAQLCQRFGPFCLDLFTSPFPHLFMPFCSRYLCKDIAAVDTFTVDWGSLTNGFFHHPVGLITRVLKHAQFVKAKRCVDRPCVGMQLIFGL